MKDGPFRAYVKTALAAQYVRAHDANRHALDARGQLHWKLAGDCGHCAHCCESPTIAVGRLFMAIPFLWRAWVWWQRAMNGFVLVKRDRDAAAFVFTCTHFDANTRKCDSYESRPGMCHDYPRMQLTAVDPELFDGCKYRVVAKNGDAMIAALEAKGVGGEQLVQIKKKLRLE